ncbi:transglycosylase SLT domain-containing protein [Desulfovibrio sp.]|uniref:transglycosylase SLT domain-containing protein n=1 Tax=Desulfovibrio sp. TaxID=885 RepID=UPI00260ECEA6|nr:transglycosylase SLT domain-containing protein [Desulfovibrio sp.]
MLLAQRRVQPAIMVLVFCALCLTLAGCGARKSASPEVSMPGVIVPESGADPLTHTEMAALKSTGHIDKDVPDQAMSDVAIQYKYFLRKGRQTMCAFSKRSEQYLDYARQVFRSKGMPEELANLAIVESGYRADAQSPAGAAGAWQFMPGTATVYGLRQDWWTDERLDPYKATEAAADYLQKLHNDFGDWPTAIAAYNAGEGKMSRAKQGTGGRNFFEVKALNHTLDEKAQLREETKQYVPRFMAVTKIMRNLPQLGFEPIQPEKAPGVLRFTAKPGTDLTAFSKACNLSWPEFASYNKHHKRRITCTDHATFVYVPLRSQQQAQKFLCTTQPANYAGWGPVKVASSADTWEKLSRRANVPVERLKAVNPEVDKLKAGQTILAPRNVNMSKAAVAALDGKGGKNAKGDKGAPRGKQKGAQQVQQPSASSRAVAAGGQHTLQANETLYAVARKYNVSVAAFRSTTASRTRASCARAMCSAFPGRAGARPRRVRPRRPRQARAAASARKSRQKPPTPCRPMTTSGRSPASIM